MADAEKLCPISRNVGNPPCTAERRMMDMSMTYESAAAMLIAE